MRRAGLAQPRRRAGAVWREPHAGAEAGEAACQPRQGHRPGRGRAAVDRDILFRQHRASQVFQRCLDGALHRMRRLNVVHRIGAGGACDAQETRVLAGAVVMKRAGHAALPRQRLRRGLVDRPVRAALQRACVEPGERQHACRRRNMAGLARMRRAGQRQFLGTQAIAVGSAGFDQWQRLEGFDRGAGDKPGIRHRPVPAVRPRRCRPRRQRRNGGFRPASRAGPRPRPDCSFFRITHCSCRRLSPCHDCVANHL